MSKDFDELKDAALTTSAVIIGTVTLGYCVRKFIFKDITKGSDIMNNFFENGITGAIIGAALCGCAMLVEGCNKLFGQTPAVAPLKSPEKEKIGAVTPSPFQSPAQLSSLRPTSGALKI